VSTAAGAILARELNELGGSDEQSFGGKSASLGELLSAGVRVPPGFALSCEAHALARASGQMPEAVRDEISRRYAELAAVAGEAEPAVAVRSSAVGEDSATATFAGQQETVLWMRGVDEICDAVSLCWDSLYSDTAVSYRAHLGDGREPAMGVTIQLMVDAAVAGVLFTCNPLSGDPSVVAINASWGLGLAVVGGEVTPDDYLVSKVTHEVVRETVSVKEVEYLPDPIARGVVLKQVPADRAGMRCLDADGLEGLLEIAGAAQRHFGSHQDVEWAIARTGTLPESLFVLQSRPVTTMEPPASAEVHEQPASALSLVMRQFGVAQGGASDGAH
jgi:pyruvate, water dikinase